MSNRCQPFTSDNVIRPFMPYAAPPFIYLSLQAEKNRVELSRKVHCPGKWSHWQKRLPSNFTAIQIYEQELDGLNANTAHCPMQVYQGVNNRDWITFRLMILDEVFAGAPEDYYLCVGTSCQSLHAYLFHVQLSLQTL